MLNLGLNVSMQAPSLTPEWNRTSHAQTVFYTEQRCIPLQGTGVLQRLIKTSPLSASPQNLCVFVRPEPRAGGFDGGRAAAAGVPAPSPEPLSFFTGQSQQPASQEMQIAPPGGTHGPRQTHAVYLSGNKRVAQPGKAVQREQTHPFGGFVCNGLIRCFRMVPAAPKKLVLRGK